MILLDTNVIIDLLNNEEDEAVKEFASDLINTKIKQIWD